MTLAEFLEQKNCGNLLAEYEDAWPRVANPAAVAALKDKKVQRAKTARQEHLIVLSLDSGARIIKTRVVTIGLVNFSLVHPREVFSGAISDNAVSIILCHNHPSGSLEPSSEDIEITRRLKLSGEILGIRLLDHVIVSSDGFYSFQEKSGLF